MGTRPMISDLKQSRTYTKLPLKGMATLLEIVSTKAYIHIKLVHRCIMNHFHSLLMRVYDYCWVGGGGRQHPIYYIIISYNFGCKWVKYSILWCQPCPNSFIWTYFHIAYTNKTNLVFSTTFIYDRFWYLFRENIPLMYDCNVWKWPLDVCD